jgi:hypothetical protein
MEMRRAEKSRNLFVEMGFVSEWECLLLPFFLKELTFLLSHLGGI